LAKQVSNAGRPFAALQKTVIFQAFFHNFFVLHYHAFKQAIEIVFLHIFPARFSANKNEEEEASENK